jgi:hypothetical protein
MALVKHTPTSITTITTLMTIIIRVTTTFTQPQTLTKIWSNITSEFGKLPKAGMHKSEN